MSMRIWNNSLFLDAMPGRKKEGRPQGDFSQWVQEMKEHAISTVVCLAPAEQIAAESPEYSGWLARQEVSGNPASGSNKAGVEIIRLPIDDFSVPVPFQAPLFWNRANEVAAKIRNGERIFIHCGAGIGRTGMFAVAVLMKLGYPYEKAFQEIKAVKSYPETPEQREFLRTGGDCEPQ